MAAILSKKTKVEVKVGNAFVQIKGLQGISGLGGGSAAVIDTTDLDSDAKEKAMGLPDEGSLKIDCNFLEADAGQLALITARAAQSLVTVKVTLSNKRVYEVDGYCMTAEPNVAVDSRIGIAFGVEISGPARLSTTATV